MPTRLVLRSFQSPGDIVMLTAAVRDLHKAYPGQFETDVRTSADALWENNPHITPLRENDPDVTVLDAHYPLIHQSNQRPYHFIHGYAQYFEQQLKLQIPVTEFRGDIHLSESERGALPAKFGIEPTERFWIIVAGGKFDFTTKWWNPASYQSVVDHFRDQLTFVQCGEKDHWHSPLRGTLNLVGKTTLREFVQLMHHAEGVLCPVTFAMHLAAAIETPAGRPSRRPCVVVAGGREPPHWEAYPHHQFIHTMGSLPCCEDSACWKSRCQLVGDGDAKDRQNVCERPVEIGADLRIPECMHLITPDDVIRRINAYVRNVGNKKSIGQPVNKRIRKNDGVKFMATETTADAAAARTPGTVRKQVLIKFRHGLGDAVQLSIVLRHLKKHRPNWDVDVAALIGKHSCFHDQCRNVLVLDRDEIDESSFDQVFNLDWDECHKSYAGCPSTKAEQCLHDVFNITPELGLCEYGIRQSVRSRQLAERYLSRVCQGKPKRGGRFPAVLIHYEGNTSPGEKNFSHEIARQACEEVIRAGYTPIVLDWDSRSPLPDGQRIFNPHAGLELWGRTGTGDAEALAALIELSSLMIGVDSGPLHVAAATSTPTLAVWTHHHPLHYLSKCDNVVNLVPQNHEQLLRGDRDTGLRFFQSNYQFRAYTDLGCELLLQIREQLSGDDGGLVHERGFWLRADNIDQDLVVVQDIAEEDSYHIEEMPIPRPIVVDVGAHIGCFSKRFHERCPTAQIIAVECCPENLPALKENIGGLAAIEQAAVTYDEDVALLNAVFPQCVSTGGSTVIGRSALKKQLEAGDIPPDRSEATDYWADERPLRTLTLEEIMQTHGLDRIDILKLDCEGSEYSILENTQSLDRIGLIVGEYHDRARFYKLIRARFSDWQLKILRDGELGTFWLARPAVVPSVVTRENSKKQKSPIPPVLVSAMQGGENPRHFLLHVENGEIVGSYEHKHGWMRGFAAFNGGIWSIDESGILYQVAIHGGEITIERVSECPLGKGAHDLTVINGKIATAVPPRCSIQLYDSAADTWEEMRPWMPPEYVPSLNGKKHDGDRFHFNSVVQNGEGFYLSLFSGLPRLEGQRWRQHGLDKGIIIKWGPSGFAKEPLAKEMFAPHSLRQHDGHVWWCDSFRHRIRRDDGWESPDLGSFVRGLRFEDDRCIAGLSRSRIADCPEGQHCGVVSFSASDPDCREFVPLDLPFTEVYDLIPIGEAGSVT